MRVCCFEQGHAGDHNYASPALSDGIPDTCLAVDPEPDYEDLLAKVSALEAERDHFQALWASAVREKHEVRNSAMDAIRTLREQLDEATQLPDVESN